jgi:hypothetical protein
MVPILATLVTNPDVSLQERFLITAMYIPYLIFPLWILGIAATDAATATGKPKRS